MGLLQAVGTHFLGLLFFSGLYLGWAAIGKKLTGWAAFGWLDKDVVGSTEAVTAYCIGFVALAPLSEWRDFQRNHSEHLAGQPILTNE
jgi:hypothetical protein